MVDNINRISNGEEAVDWTKIIPVAMFDKEVLDALTPEQATELEKSGWQGNYDFRAKFEKLWGLR